MIRPHKLIIHLYHVTHYTIQQYWVSRDHEFKAFPDQTYLGSIGKDCKVQLSLKPKSFNNISFMKSKRFTVNDSSGEHSLNLF